ncbi:MAG: Crp/Fnr family transcriptional regulator [Rhodospirillales bacterium]
MASLAGIELLSDLRPEERKALEAACSFKAYSPHEQIIDRAQESRDVCFVVTGHVRIVLYSLSGREVTLDDLGPGTYFGELAALDGHPRSASAMALDQVLIGFMPSDVFVGMLETHAVVALKLMRRMARVVRNSTERIMDLSTLGANNRVHAELLRQALRQAESNGQARIRPIPVHGDIASRVSTTRETVARVMNDLARMGIVQRTKDCLVIRDLPGLRELVENVRGE